MQSHSSIRTRLFAGRRRTLAVIGAVGLVAFSAGGASAANPGTATLSNGAQVSVSITSPATGTEYSVPVGNTSVDVPVAGSASIGIGAPDATIIYVMDVSGSTTAAAGACGTVLQCEKAFFVALNNAVVLDGSTAAVGLVTFSSGATTGLGLTAPSSALVGPAINLPTAGGGTNCTAGLNQAASLLSAATTSKKIVVFASDGFCNAGGSVTSSALASTTVVVHSVAIGSGSSCTANGGLGSLTDIAQNGGSCTAVTDPNNLPNIIPSIIGSRLDSLSIKVDAGTATAITNATIDPDLPQPGAASVTYTSSALGLTPGQHEICVNAVGKDVLGDTKTATACVTVQVVQLSATPPTATNELGSDNQHTVTATVAGDPSVIGGRLVTFTVTGQNAGATGACTPNADCTTDSTGKVSFTYNVPKVPASLGTDSIGVATPLGSPPAAVTVTLEKKWVDTTPPSISCAPTTNPSGGNVPTAGANPKSGQNPDGFYVLTATDSVDPNPQIRVADSASSSVFGPFAGGTKIKLVQAPGATPSQKPGPGVINWHITLKGDARVTATDSSGNTSAPIFCLVPRPPK